MTAVAMPPTAGRRQVVERLAAAVVTPMEEPGWWSIEFRALGSGCELIFQCDTPEVAQTFRKNALHWLGEFESRFSRFLPDSLVSKINAAAGNGQWQAVDPTCESLLDLCKHAHFLSQGGFDATSLPLSRLWDFHATNAAPPQPEQIAAALQQVGWDKVEREPGKLRLPQAGMAIDFGGVGKEFAVDALIYLAQQHGLKNALIDLGKDVRVIGSPPEGGSWTIGLEVPVVKDGQAACHGVVKLRDGVAVATSGDYRRCFQHQGQNYGHIIDCRTGWPVDHGTTCVTVVAKTCVTAGCMATAAMALGGETALEMLKRLPHIEAMLWHHGSKLQTPGFQLSPLPPDWEE